MGQGNPTLGPEQFRQKLDRASFLTNYSGPRVGFPCPTTIHMKDTLNLTYQCLQDGVFHMLARCRQICPKSLLDKLPEEDNIPRGVLYFFPHT